MKVLVLNINPGMNKELKEKCPSLNEYVIYVERVRSYAKKLPLEEAVEKAIEECIKENVLREFLTKQKAEVFKMSIYEYDEERELKLMLADERELGKQEGIQKGKLEEKENTIRIVIIMSKEMGNTKEKTIELLRGKCNLEQEKAQEAVEKYWDDKE